MKPQSLNRSERILPVCCAACNGPIIGVQQRSMLERRLEREEPVVIDIGQYSFDFCSTSCATKAIQSAVNQLNEHMTAPPCKECGEPTDRMASDGHWLICSKCHGPERNWLQRHQ